MFNDEQWELTTGGDRPPNPSTVAVVMIVLF
jgi:hypothetical protein